MTVVYATFRFSLLITSRTRHSPHFPGTPITRVASGPRMSPRTV